jgi:hypothetical protein
MVKITLLGLALAAAAAAPALAGGGCFGSSHTAQTEKPQSEQSTVASEKK